MSSSSYEVDSMILLQMLVEYSYITQSDSLEQLLLGISGIQGKALLGWIHRPTLKMRVIVMRALANESDHCHLVEELYRECQRNRHHPNNMGNDDTELLAQAFASVIVAWSKREDLERIQYWLKEYDNDSQLPPLNSTAQTAILRTMCKISGPQQAEDYLKTLSEDYLLSLETIHKEGRIPYLPDTVLWNMVLNGWAQGGHGDRAAALLRNHIRQPDAISYNTVINAYAKAGELDEAEKYVIELLDMYQKNPMESNRPDSATFTVLLAGWRRSRDGTAGDKSERILIWMNDLYEEGIVRTRPNLKSYEVVLDTLAKSKSPNWHTIPQRVRHLVASSPYRNDPRLKEKIRFIDELVEARRRKRKGKGNNQQPLLDGS